MAKTKQKLTTYQTLMKEAKKEYDKLMKQPKQRGITVGKVMDGIFLDVVLKATGNK